MGARDANLIAVLRQVDVLNARTATGAMLALITNKAAILSDVDSAPANRRLLRDKADGVARRAALIEQQMGRLRS